MTLPARGGVGEKKGDKRWLRRNIQIPHPREITVPTDRADRVPKVHGIR